MTDEQYESAILIKHLIGTKEESIAALKKASNYTRYTGRTQSFSIQISEQDIPKEIGQKALQLIIDYLTQEVEDLKKQYEAV